MKLALLAKRHSIHSVRWVNALARRGHEVHLITAERFGEVLDPAVSVHFLPVPPPLGFYLNAPALQRLLTNLRPDLLNAHFASGYGTLARLSGFHPTVLSVWGSDVFDFPRKSRWHAGLIAANLAFADKVTSTSEVMARHTHTLNTRVRPTVVPFGIDIEHFAPRSQLHTDTNERVNTPITIGTVKTLAPKYGIDTLIEAFALLRLRLEGRQGGTADGLRLRIVGGGQQRAELERLAEAHAIADVTTFVGQVDHAEVSAQLSEIDIYVALSRLDSESFGVAVLEASANALPVVVSDVGGLPEVVVDGVTGIVVARDDAKAAVAALESLVLNPERRADMGAAGRQHVVDNYSWDASVTRMEAVYYSVLSVSSTSEASR